MLTPELQSRLTEIQEAGGVTLHQFCKVFGIPPRTAYERRRQGVLKTQEINGMLFVEGSEAQNFLTASCARNVLPSTN